MAAAPSLEIPCRRKQPALPPVTPGVDSQKIVELLAPWNGRRLNVAGIARTLGISRPTASARIKRLEQEGLIRLLPFFGSGHKPLLRLVGWYDDRPESFRSFCTDAVVAGLRGIDPECRFYYWKTGRIRQIDLLAVIAQKRIGFCVSSARCSQNRHWWPLRLAWRRGIIDLGYLLNPGHWSRRIGREMYERPIGTFLSALVSAEKREPLWGAGRDPFVTIPS